MATVILEIVDGSFAPLAPKTRIEVRRTSTARALVVAVAAALSQTRLDFAALMAAVQALGHVPPEPGEPHRPS